MSEPRCYDSVWVKDGELIYISEMTDSHLTNAISWLERNVGEIVRRVNQGWSTYMFCRGQMESLRVERLIDNAEDYALFCTDALYAMKAEVEYRKYGRKGWDRV